LPRFAAGLRFTPTPVPGLRGAAGTCLPQSATALQAAIEGGDLPLTALLKQSQNWSFREAIHRNKKISSLGGSQMNKNDLISEVAAASGLSKSDAANAVESVFDTITKALSGGDEVRLVGFGTFSVAKRKASIGRNPRTGEEMKIKASNQPKFKAGKGLKDAVN
jgi:DNA-binding protein HU-beta